MRSSSIPTSLVLLASAALHLGACGEAQTEPGGTGATPPSTATTTQTGAMTAAAGAGAGSATKPVGTGTATPPTTAAPATGGAGMAASTAMTSMMTATSAGSSAATSGGAAGTAMSMSGAAGGGAAGGGAAAAGAPTFTRVFDEVFGGCGVGACHGNSQTPSALGLSDKMDAYMGLVGIKAMGKPLPNDMSGAPLCMGMDIMRVKAGDPDNSLLMQKLENKQKCGAQMPPGGMVKPDQIELVRAWIMAGAKND